MVGNIRPNLYMCDVQLMHKKEFLAHDTHVKLFWYSWMWKLVDIHMICRHAAIRIFGKGSITCFMSNMFTTK